MPFVEVYRVNFAGGNLQPSLNTVGWPHMMFSMESSNDLAGRVADAEGTTLFLTRHSTVTTPA